MLPHTTQQVRQPRKDGMKVARKKLMPPTELSTNAWLCYLLSFHVLISLPPLPVPTLY